MKSISPVIEHHPFTARDLVGGDAALDFVNTVTGRDQTPRDWLESYASLLEWAGQARLLPPKTLRRLSLRAKKDPAAAARALARAKRLREALFAVMSRVVAGSSPPNDALALLREHWIAGLEMHELRYRAGRVAAELNDDTIGLDLVASMVAYRLVEFVLTQPADRLRICQGPSCSWLFIDSSKAGRRRWCDMAVCGNAAKSRRFYARERGRA